MDFLSSQAKSSTKTNPQSTSGKTDGSKPSPVELGTSHAVRAYGVYPPFVTKLGNLVTPFLEKDLDASVGLSDICLKQDPLFNRSWEIPRPAGACAGISVVCKAHGVWRLAMALCVARQLVIGVIRLQGLRAKGTWVPAGPGCPKPV